MRSISKYLLGFSAALLLSIGILAGSELTIRYLATGQGYYWEETEEAQDAIRLTMFPANSRYVFRPSSDYIADLTDDLERAEYELRTDDLGFILPGRVHSEPELTIAFLGGSTTENFLMPAEARFPHLVGRQIEACTGLRVNTLNTGRSGITSMHSLNTLLSTVIPHKPRHVVLMHNINDYAVLHHEGSYWNDHPDRSLKATIPEHSGGLKQSLRSFLNSWVPRTSYWLRSTLRGSSGAGSRDSRWETPKQIEIESIVQQFSQSLETFVEAARIWGIEPILMTMPSRWPEVIEGPDSKTDALLRRTVFEVEDYGEFLAGFDQMNEAIRRVGAEQGVGVIDLALSIPKERSMFFDAIHFKEQGSRIAAEIISTQLCQEYTQ